MPGFTVSCNCPTPLAHNPFVCEAESQDAAIKCFFKANGISGTSHKITVQPVAAESPEPEPQPVSEPEPITPEQTAIVEVSETVPSSQPSQPKKKVVKNEPQPTSNDKG